MQNNSTTSHTSALKSVLPFFNRNGVIIEKIIGGFRVFGKKCLTIEQVDDVIEEAKMNLQKSVKS
jgi:hypothetical protein